MSLAVVIVVFVLASLVACSQEMPPVGGPKGTGIAENGALDAALLPSNELGPDWREGPGLSGPPAWPGAQDGCPRYQDTDYPAQGHRRNAVQRRYQSLTSSLTAHHVVERYDPGWAQRALDDTRRVLRSCSEYAFQGARISFAVIESGFLGENALLIRGRIEYSASQATVAYFVTVRRGDVISTLNLPDPGDESAVRIIATKQAGRLG